MNLAHDVVLFMGSYLRASEVPSKCVLSENLTSYLDCCDNDCLLEKRYQLNVYLNPNCTVSGFKLSEIRAIVD